MVTFGATRSTRFRLAPVYDRLSMLWARAEELPELSAEFRRTAHDASVTLRERHSRFA